MASQRDGANDLCCVITSNSLLGRLAIPVRDGLPFLQKLNTTRIPLDGSVPYHCLQHVQGHLGKIKVYYKIALHPDAKPFAGTHP